MSRASTQPTEVPQPLIYQSVDRSDTSSDSQSVETNGEDIFTAGNH